MTDGAGPAGGLSAIERIGHVGLFVHDLEVMTRFYTDVLDFSITDRSDEMGGIVFLSTRPDDEHHMILLMGGRTAPAGTKLLQQLSLRVTSLSAVLEYRRRLRAAGARLDRDISHGNAIGVYFFDPEGNRLEVYWQTPYRDAPQPFVEPIDLDRPESDVLAQLAQTVRARRDAGA